MTPGPTETPIAKLAANEHAPPHSRGGELDRLERGLGRWDPSHFSPRVFAFLSCYPPAMAARYAKVRTSLDSYVKPAMIGVGWRQRMARRKRAKLTVLLDRSESERFTAYCNAKG